MCIRDRNTTDETTGDMGILFDIPTLFKTMMGNAMNNSRNIQREPTNLTNLVYPIDLTPTHAYILPLRTSNSSIRYLSNIF